MSALTLSEKLIARAAQRETVTPGEEVWAIADRMIMNDSSGPRRIAKLIEELGGVWDRDRVVLVSDHFTPAANRRHAEILETTRTWARDNQIKHFYEFEGVMHNLMLDRWLVQPGMLLIGADSHTISAGAMGAFATPVGSTELATVLATGKIWLRVPQTIRIELEGELGRCLTLRDVTMKILSDFSASFATYRSLEYGGSFVEKLTMEQRLVLANQGIEMGAKNAVVEPSEWMFEAMEKAGIQQQCTPLYPDKDAQYLQTLQYDLNQLEPMVAAPHSPDNVVPISDVGSPDLSAAWMGSCVGGRLTDIRVMAQLLQGKRVRIPTTIVPATQEIYQASIKEGLLGTLVQAGCNIQSPGCGACAGLHSGILGPDDTIISTGPRNFAGRMGSRQAKIFLGNPYTLAASAIAGKIIDPREVL